MAAHGGDTSYRVKTIDFLNRSVPIMMQNANGPCPLLALANVMLLRNRISLPTSTTSVTQERLISLVAGHLLDCNDEQRLARLDSGTAANLRQNIADAIAQLPKLATGLDVNVRFQDIRGFEFTQDTAIFDLLDVRLLHGWLVDPQDQATAECISHHSYNQLVSLIVECLGEDATPLQTPKATPGAAQGKHSAVDDSKPPGAPASSAACAPGAADIPSQDTRFTAAAGEAELRGGGSSSGAVAVQSPHPDSRPVDANALADALQDVHMDSEESQQLQAALALSLQDTGRPTAQPQPPPPDNPGGTIEEEGGGPHHPHSSPTSTPARPPDHPATAVPTVSQPAAAQHPGEASTAHNAPSSGAAEGVGSQTKGRADEFLDLDPLGGAGPAKEPEDVATGAVGAGAEAESRAALPAIDEGGSSGAAESGSHQPGIVEGHGEASSSGSYNEEVRSRRQPLKMEQYDAAAIAKGKMPAYLVLPATEQGEEELAEQAGGGGEGAAEGTESYQQSEKRAQEMQRATTIQAFFDRTSSQLTEHGLASLHQGMRPNELGILFRNNHFNTLFAHNGSIWMLATDQGYLYEDVVWERLSDVAGNNEFCRADFTPYVKHPSSDNVHTAVQLTQEAFASGMRGKGGLTPDADLALAMQMQDEENERQARFLDQQRRAAGQWTPPRETPPGGRVSPNGRGAQQRPSSTAHSGGGARNARPGSGRPKDGKSKSGICAIM